MAGLSGGRAAETVIRGGKTLARIGLVVGLLGISFLASLTVFDRGLGLLGYPREWNVLTRAPSQNIEGAIRFHTNAEGAPDEPVPPKRLGERRAMITGDSITEGWNINPEERFSATMQERLGFRVINVAQGGKEPLWALLSFDHFAAAYEPDYYFIAVSPNDVIESVPEGNSESRHDLFEARRDLIRRQMHGASFPPFDRQVQALWPRTFVMLQRVFGYYPDLQRYFRNRVTELVVAEREEVRRLLSEATAHVIAARDTLTDGQATVAAGDFSSASEATAAASTAAAASPIVDSLIANARANRVPEDHIRAWRNRLLPEDIEEIEKGYLSNAIISIAMVRPDYWSYNFDLDTPEAEASWVQMRFYLDLLITQARTRGTRPFILYLPHPVQYERDYIKPLYRRLGITLRPDWYDHHTEMQRRLSAFAASLGVPYFDLQAPLRAYAGDTESLHFRGGNPHLTPLGNRIAGRAIADWLVHERLLE